jgi:hypothetical protein
MDFDGLVNTTAIVNATTTAGTYPAAESAASFSAHTEAVDGVEDTSDWHLPGLGVLIIICKYWNQIQSTLESFWNADARMVLDGTYFSSTQCAASTVFTITSFGNIFATSKTSKGRVRAVCDEI